MGLRKAQKQGRDENTRRLSCCRKVVVKKDWKTTLLLLQLRSIPDKSPAPELKKVNRQSDVTSLLLDQKRKILTITGDAWQLLFCALSLFFFGT